jgi:hypothetical protein
VFNVGYVVVLLLFSRVANMAGLARRAVTRGARYKHNNKHAAGGGGAGSTGGASAASE